MPDILDQLQAGQVAETNANLAQAKHDSDWASWFTSTPPSEVLRQNLNLTSMIDSAVEQKQRILAQTDENAQRIYLNNKRFQAEQELQPLKVRHAQAQIDHETALTNAVGAHDLYLMDQDKQEAADYAAMLGDIKSIESTHGSPDYIKSIYTAALSHPKGAMSTAGRELINSHIQRHKSLTELQSEAEAAGVDVSGGTLDKSGNASIQFKPPMEPADFFTSKDQALKAGGKGATVRQDQKGRGWYVQRVTDTQLPTGVSENYATVINHLARDRKLLTLPDEKLPSNETRGGIEARIAGNEAARVHFESKHPELRATVSGVASSPSDFINSALGKKQ